MSKVNAKVNFRKGFKGELLLDNGNVTIGKEGAAPYDLLQGALASCLHATFLEILKKKQIQISGCDYVLSGNKKEDVPTTLNVMHLDVYIEKHEKEEQIRKSFDLATKYCSIYQTISKVAEMSYNLYFIEVLDENHQ